MRTRALRTRSRVALLHNIHNACAVDAIRKMGNISCSCSPTRKAAAKTAAGKPAVANARHGHVLRLWAEVFHVSASSGAVRWTQMSDDLVPVVVSSATNGRHAFHVTAYNSRVDKVLDTWLSGARLGQASACFVYWKDSVSGDTWGLNFTSAADARAFRECVSASRDFRRAESSFSLRESSAEHKSRAAMHANAEARSRQSAPASPNAAKRRVNDCTCDCVRMDTDALHRTKRNGRVRYNPSPAVVRQDSGGSASTTATEAAVMRRAFGARGAVRSMETPSATAAATSSRSRTSERARASQESALRTSRSTDNIRRELQKEASEPKPKTSTTATDTEDLPLKPETLKRLICPLSDARPKSMGDVSEARGREQRSSEGRRRSLERTQCFELFEDGVGDDYYVATRNDELDAFEALLSGAGDVVKTRLQQKIESDIQRSIEDVAILMREVQNELTQIRREEALRTSRQRCQSLMAISASAPLNRSSAPILDTLSIDGQLPLLYSSAHSSTFSSFDDPLLAETDSRFAFLSEVSDASVDRSDDRSPRAVVVMCCSSMSFDARLLTERGQPSLAHRHDDRLDDRRSVDDCERHFLRLQISDDGSHTDDRASLTTADDDNDFERADSPHARRRVSSTFSCSGSVRKSGFLCVKKWLLRKRHSLELARRRGWKRYWVCLKGTALLFYNCESGGAIDALAKHVIFVDQSLAVPIPEHPKREHVFCLSTAFGDAYLMDAPCISERDLWIVSIHCACAANISRVSGKAGVVASLHEECARAERQVESLERQRHETELTHALVSGDDRSRQQLLTALLNFDDRLEKQRVDLYRFKCYVSALSQSDDIPNAKSLLSHVSRRTKQTLNRLGVFAVSSLHALTSAKSPSLSFSSAVECEPQSSQTANKTDGDGPLLALVVTVNGERRSLQATTDWTMNDVLSALTSSSTPISDEYFVRSSNQTSEQSSDWTIHSHYETVGGALSGAKRIEILPKVLFSCEMSRQSENQLFGFSVESEVEASRNAEGTRDLRVLVSRVEPNSIAQSRGLRAGDELVVLNGACVADLDMLFVESLLSEECALALMVRSARDCPPPEASADRPTTDELIDALVCPPPPSDAVVMDDAQISELIVPLPPSHAPPNRTLAVIRELLDTEQSYVASLEHLLNHYLEPLSHSGLLSAADMQTLFGSLLSIIDKQKAFQSELLRETAASDHSPARACERVAQAFARNGQNFRDYSSFCASHSRAVKLLADERVRHWLGERSGGQVAQTLESFLIRPIQRVLKYPLLLQQMRQTLDRSHGNESAVTALSEAIRTIEKVCDHINEMQRIHDEYGAIFEHLQRQHRQNRSALFDANLSLTPQTLLHYGGVEWINCGEYLGKSARKGVELHSMCFVFNACVVFLCKERIRHRKRGTSSTPRSDVEIIRHQTLVPVSEVQVRACAQMENESDFKWDLIQLKTNAGKRSEKTFRLSNSTCEYRNAFLRTIRQIIREDVRQMKLTTVTSVRNDGAVKATDEPEVTNSTVSCGFCGKDVAMGSREKCAEEAFGERHESPVWKRRSAASSTATATASAGESANSSSSR